MGSLSGEKAAAMEKVNISNKNMILGTHHDVCG